jgi:hypothetical protein
MVRWLIGFSSSRLDSLASLAIVTAGEPGRSGRVKDLEIIVLRRQVNRPALTEANRGGLGEATSTGS